MGLDLAGQQQTTSVSATINSGVKTMLDKPMTTPELAVSQPAPISPISPVVEQPAPEVHKWELVRSGNQYLAYKDGKFYGGSQIGYENQNLERATPNDIIIKDGVTIQAGAGAQAAARAVAAQQAADAARAASHAAHNEEQARGLSNFQGAVASGEIRSATTPGLPIGIEAMKVAEKAYVTPAPVLAPVKMDTTIPTQGSISNLNPFGSIINVNPMKPISTPIIETPIPMAPIAAIPKTSITSQFGTPSFPSNISDSSTQVKFGFVPPQPGSIAQKAADVKLIKSKGGALAMALTAPTSFGTTFETFHTDADALLYGKNSPQAIEAKNALISTTANRIREIEGRDTLTNLVMIPLEAPITMGLPIGAGFKVGTSVLEAGLKVGAEQVAKRAGESLVPRVISGGLNIGSKLVEPVSGAIFLAPIVSDIASSKDTGEAVAKVVTFGVSLPSFELGTGLGGKITSKIEKVSGAKWGTFDVPQYGLKDIPGSEKVSQVIRTRVTEPLFEPIKSSFKDPARDFILEPLKSRLEPIKTGVSNIVKPMKFGFKEPLKTFVNEPIKTGIKSITPKDQFEFMPSSEVGPTRDIYKQVSPQAKTMMKTSFEAINLIGDIPESAVKGMYQPDVSFGSTKDVGLEGLKIEKVMKQQPRDIMEGSFSTAKFVKGFREVRTPTPGGTKLGTGIGDIELTSVNPSGYKGIKTEKFDAYKEITKHSKSFAFGKVGETVTTPFGGKRTIISGGKVIEPIQVGGIRYLSPLQQASQKLEGSVKYMARKTDILSGDVAKKEFNTENEMTGFSSRRGKDVQDVPEIVEALAKAHPDIAKGQKALELMKQYREAEATKLYAKEPVSTLIEYGYKYAKENPTTLAGAALGYNLNKSKSTTPAFLSSTYSTPTKGGTNLIETSYTPTPKSKTDSGYSNGGNKPTTPAFLATYATPNKNYNYPYPTTPKTTPVDGGYYPTPKPVDPIGGGYYQPPPPKTGGGYYGGYNPNQPLRPYQDRFWGGTTEIPSDYFFDKNGEKVETKRKSKRKEEFLYTYHRRDSPIFGGAEKLFEGIQAPRTSQKQQIKPKYTKLSKKTETFDLGLSGFTENPIKTNKPKYKKTNKNVPSWL